MPIKKREESRADLMARLTQPKKRSEKEISESEVKAKIRKWLSEAFGEELAHFHYSARGGAPGVSDRICCYKGKFIGIEAKRPSKRNHKDGGQAADQRSFEKTIRAAGGHYILAHSLDDVKEYFNKYLA